MDFDDNIYGSICRVCLKHEGNEKMVCLVDKSSDNGLSCYGKAVVTFANVIITYDDYFPKKMCHECLLLLKYAISFKMSCESSYKKLLKLQSLTENGHQKIKENIMEYTVFMQYFPQDCLEEEITDIESATKSEKADLKCDETINCHDSTDSDNNDEPLIYFSQNGTTNLKEDAYLDKLEEMLSSDAPISNIYTKDSSNPSKGIFRRKLKRNKLNLTKNNEKKHSLICRLCDKLLANQNTYDHHMQRHKGCRYICEHCGKGFPVLAELQVHQVSRHGTGPYLECKHCNFKAPRKFDLIEHERLHTGERPYTCDKCGLTFRRRGIWKKHLIYHNEKNVQCEQCPRKFHQRSEMLAHMNNVHERLYVYLCNKCGATYAKGATVRRHLTERHGIPRELQGKIIRVHKNKGNEFTEH